MTNHPEFDQAWTDFLKLWPLSRVRAMTLDEYTNANQSDAYIYWLEKHLDKVGSIWGGSAFKFGIYRRANFESSAPSGGRIWGDKYAWQSKFGKTEDEAFATIRARIVEVIEAAQAGNVERIDQIDLAHVLKWKIAFHYQDRDRACVLPIFKKEMLFHLYQAIDPTAKFGDTPQSLLYTALIGRAEKGQDIIAIGDALLAKWQSDKAVRAWVVPIGWLPQTAIDTLLGTTSVSADKVDPSLETMLAAQDLAEGDRLVLLLESNIRAIAKVSSADPSDRAWDQTLVDMPSGLLVQPTSQMRKLEAAEWSDIQKRLAKAPHLMPAVAEATPHRYWKIAPGRGAVAWEYWRDHGIAAIGWADLGDLSGCTQAEFAERAKKEFGTEKPNEGPYQVWTFRQIEVGDKILANRGTTEVLAIGEVVGAYRFCPDIKIGDDSDYAHQLLVQWTDTHPRKVAQGGWRKTLLELDRGTFDSIAAMTADVEVKTPPAAPDPAPPAPPCNPQNIILFGPPGTGKTYSTVRRALELILGAKSVAGLNDKALTAMFRDHQSRGQIEFVTFHQSYGYEEFVEGLRPVLNTADGGAVRYELHDGAFKRIALRAAAAGLLAAADPAPDAPADTFADHWDAALKLLHAEEAVVMQAQAGHHYRLSATERGSVVVERVELDKNGDIKTETGKRQTASRDGAQMLWAARAQLGPVESWTYKATENVFVEKRGIGGGHHYTAYWLAFKLMEQLKISPPPPPTAVRTEPTTVDVQQALDRSSSGAASFAFTSQTRQFVLIIDEINRGNVSKILGELITLLEADKRLGARSELKLPLTYSPGHRFAVPPNLHVLGTMNTADRSIALMDVALRRRFTFEELMPQTDVIRKILSDNKVDAAVVDLTADLFATLNHRIRFLYDRDHQLGHAYFLDVASLEGLRKVMVDRVIPLLQEYFYGAWPKTAIVLGCPYDEAGRPLRKGHLVANTGAGQAYAAPMIQADVFGEEATLGFDHDDYENRLDFYVSPNLRTGRLGQEQLARTLLGLLDLQADVFAHRLALLAPALAVAAPTAESVSAG